MAPSLSPRRRSKVLLAAASVVATLACLEIGIRVFDAARGRSWNARASWHWMFEPDPYTGYRGRASVEAEFGSKGVSRHNRDGFRDERELAEIVKVGGHRLVVCVGESSTYGIGAPTAREAYPARLEAHLRKASGRDDWYVYNAGYPAFTSYQVVQLLHLRLLKFRPTAVVMMDLRNDVELVSKRIDDDTDYDRLASPLAPFPKTWRSEIAMRSALVSFIASRFHDSRPIDTPIDGPAHRITPRGMSFYADNIATAALLCRRGGVPLLVVDQPVFDEAHQAERRLATAQLRAIMQNTCREEAIPLLEADRPLHAAGFRSPHEVHLGPDGNDRLAAILAPQILRAIDGTRDR